MGREATEVQAVETEEGAMKLGDLVWADDEPNPGVIVDIDTYSGESVPWIGVLVGDGEIHWYRPRGLRKIQ